MKNLVGIVLSTAVMIVSMGILIHDFISSDGLHYFTEHPHRLLIVVVIGVSGGFGIWGFSSLPPGLRKRAKLALLGLGGFMVMLEGGLLSYRITNLPARIDPTLPRQIPWLLVLPLYGSPGCFGFNFTAF